MAFLLTDLLLQSKLHIGPALRCSYSPPPSPPCGANAATSSTFNGGREGSRSSLDVSERPYQLEPGDKLLFPELFADAQCFWCFVWVPRSCITQCKSLYHFIQMHVSINLSKRMYPNACITPWVTHKYMSYLSFTDKFGFSNMHALFHGFPDMFCATYQGVQWRVLHGPSDVRMSGDTLADHSGCYWYPNVLDAR